MNSTIKTLAIATNVGLLMGLWLNEGEGITSMAGLVSIALVNVFSIIAITMNKTKKY